MTIVKELNNGFYKTNKVEERPVVLDDVTNYDYVDLTKYGYKRVREEMPTPLEGEEPKTSEEILKGNLDEVLKCFLSEYSKKHEALDNELNNLNNDRDNKVSACNNECDDKVKKVTELYNMTVEKNNKELLAKEKEVTKATSKSKNKANKLLQESRKAL